MPDIRFVYFDLDDTLLDHRHAERWALTDLCEAYPDHFVHALEEIQDRYHAHNVVLWRQYSLGEIEKAELRRLRFELLLRDLAISDLEAADAGTAYMEYYHQHWRYIDGAQEAFHAIADRLPVGILTNGFAEVQHAKLDQFPELRERSDTVVISEEVGYMKPHPHLFDHATRLAEVPAECILYVGDSFHSDVEGGLRAGWHVAWYAPNGTPPRKTEAMRFDAWDELIAWLDDTLATSAQKH
jgi:YjjG family noncanonical pyrimidine nucleotidase